MMRTLVYKRTHNGDPDRLGRFGIRDCMGRVRSLDFEAVIGVGGQGAKAEFHEIAGKVNWIGIGAHKVWAEGMRDPLVMFDHFLDFGTDGPDLHVKAPKLAERMYVKKARITLKFSPQEQAEVDRLLERAMTASPSAALSATTMAPKRRRCRTVRC